MPGGSEWLLILLIVPLYFLPTIIANSRKSANSSGVFVLNFLLGWTILGWIGALIWAVTSSPKQATTVIVNNTSQSYSQEYKDERPEFKQTIQPQVAQTKMLIQQDKIDQLRQFKQLLDEGIITSEEFNSQKAAILG